MIISFQESVEGEWINPKFFRYFITFFGACFISLNGLFDQFVRIFCLGMNVPKLSFPRRIKPAFVEHIFGIFFLSSNKKVVRIATNGIVASMTNRQVPWNISMKLSPNQPMGDEILTSHSQSSISKFVKWTRRSMVASASPVPAILNGSSFDFAPYFVMKCWSFPSGIRSFYSSFRMSHDVMYGYSQGGVK